MKVDTTLKPYDFGVQSQEYPEHLTKDDELCLSCREGDMDKVVALVENQGMEVNYRDRWDSCPLYYACLAGHEAIVKYLLSQGARCEEQTFDGERCVYAALTSKIRNLLREFRLNKGGHQDQQGNHAIFYRFLNSVFQTIERYSEDSLDHLKPDFRFKVSQSIIGAHKCILSCRCPRFTDKFKGSWKDKTSFDLPISERVDATAFKEVMRWLYCGRIELPWNKLDQALLVCKSCRLIDLHERLIEAAQESEQDWVVVGDSDSLLADFGPLVAVGGVPPLPLEETEGVLISQAGAPFVDMIITVFDQGKPIKYGVHSLFIKGRCSYFQAFCSTSWSNAKRCNLAIQSNQSTKQVECIALNELPVEIFEIILEFLYKDHVADLEELDYRLILKCLEFSHLFILPTLSHQLANALVVFLDALPAFVSLDQCEILFDILFAAKLYSLVKLEQATHKKMAKEVLTLVKHPDFREMITQDAQSIEDRQETDSIPMIDEMRSFITDTKGLDALEDLLFDLDFEV